MAQTRPAWKSASREDVLRACFKTSGTMLVAGCVLRISRSEGWPYLVASTWSEGTRHALVALGTAATVTLARKFLLEASESFRDATDRSNAQILPSLAKDPMDIAWVSFAPALGEEALFRCALVPAIASDWRGVCIAGSVFGLLHLSGGRNWTFVAWASFVGCVYGAAMLLTEDGMVPIVAHALANAASAWMWIKKHEDIVNDYYEAKDDRLYRMEKLKGTSDTLEDQGEPRGNE